MVVGALASCALFHYVYDLKATQMNVQHSLIQEIMLYKFEEGHNAVKATKNFCCEKGEDAVDHTTVSR